MDIKKDIEHNDVGQKITVEIQLEYEDLIVNKLPKSCSACPVGFSHNANCGRNVPFEKEDYRVRPKTCKLTELNLVQLLYGADYCPVPNDEGVCRYEERIPEQRERGGEK